MAHVIAEGVDDAEKQENGRIAVESPIRLGRADAVLGNCEVFLNRFDGHGSEIGMHGHSSILSLCVSWLNRLMPMPRMP